MLKMALAELRNHCSYGNQGKSINEVRQKALAAPYWQVKRNKSGKELHRLQTNKMREKWALDVQVEKITDMFNQGLAFY